MQSHIDESDDESGVKRIQVKVEVHQVDPEAIILKMPVSKTAGSPKNCDDTATPIADELELLNHNFNHKSPIPVSKTAGSWRSYRGGILKDDGAIRISEDFRAKDNNFNREKVGKTVLFSETTESRKGYRGAILKDSATRVIEEIGAKDDNFDREKAGKTIQENYDFDPNGNVITVKKTKKLKDRVRQLRRRIGSVTQTYQVSRAAEYLDNLWLEDREKNPPVSGSTALEKPYKNAREKKSKCTIL